MPETTVPRGPSHHNSPRRHKSRLTAARDRSSDSLHINSTALFSIVANQRVSLNQRRGAVALFGYLGYTCNTDELDSLIAEASDAPPCALLTWLRYWIVTELKGLRDQTNLGH